MAKAFARPVPVPRPESPMQVFLEGLLRSLGQPERRSAFYALFKATALIGALWEYVWLWHIKYFSKHYADVPISIAWSLLTVIGGITFAQIGCSAVLKARSNRLREINSRTSRMLTEMLAEYISNGECEEELNRHAMSSIRAFEDVMTGALLSTRGVAHDRLCELPAMAIMRDRWIDALHKRDPRDRRYAVEHLALLRDKQATMALEYALDDQNQGVVASAIRGLLRIPGYPDRVALIASLPKRPCLIRVLTGGDSTAEMASEMPAASPHGMVLAQLEAVAESINLRHNDRARSSCQVLAASGPKGRVALRNMSAEGTGGDAPAEALGGLLAAAARGGRT